MMREPGGRVGIRDKGDTAKIGTLMDALEMREQGVPNETNT